MSSSLRWLQRYLVVFALPCVSASAQRDSTLSARPRLFSKRDVLLAAGFLAATVAVAPADRYFAKLLQDSSAQSDKFVRLVSTDVSAFGRPGLLIISSSFFVVGKLTRAERLAHFGLHATEAMVVAEAGTGILKVVGGRARPREDIDHAYNFSIGRGARKNQFRSFPSSHSGSAFAFAAVATEEVARGYPGAKWCLRAQLCIPPAWVVGTAAYGGASVIGLTRMYNNEHWASDVLVGAAIGTFAGLKVVQYNHIHPHTRLDRWLLSTTLMPSGVGGLALAWSSQGPF